MLVDICLPVKDEAKILEKNLQRLLSFCRSNFSGFSWRLVILDNGSSDSSRQIIDDLTANNPEVMAVFYQESGKGLALRRYWSASQADFLVCSDIDLAVSPEQLPALLEPLFSGEAVAVIGSRLLPQSQTERSWRREISSRIFNLLARLILSVSVSDLQCGFKAVDRRRFEEIAGLMEEDAWLFDTELICLLQRRGFLIKELPVEWRENRYDERRSKVHVLRDSISFIRGIIALRQRLPNKKTG
jgi:glycosyltransferase involved in cell wall biosynthesis